MKRDFEKWADSIRAFLLLQEEELLRADEEKEDALLEYLGEKEKEVKEEEVKEEEVEVKEEKEATQS